MESKIQDHLRVISSLTKQVPLLEKLGDLLIERFRGGGRLYLCGNGGSAADAQHIAAELVGRFKRDHRPLPVIALTTDTSTLTAVSNDFHFDQIFSRQVEALIAPADVLWALSVSGTSPNVIAALQRAKKIGAATLGFTGRSGGEMRRHCDLCLCIDHDQSDRVQEAHQLAYHLICERIEEAFAR